MEGKKVAVFIDAENISYKQADKIFDEAKAFGDVILKKIYGDWSKESLKPWKDVIAKYSLVAEQQFTFAKGKNSCDIALMIQAICAVFENNIDVFCLATSDSDFTRLVQVLQERQKTVVGFGRKKAVPAFINAFNEYIYLDLDEESKETKTTGKKQTVRQNPKSPVANFDETRYQSLREIIGTLVDDGGKAYLSQVSTEMKRRYADFVPKNYGCSSMRELIKKLLTNLPKYELTIDNDGTSLYIQKIRKK